MSFISNFFKGKKEPAFDIEKAVGTYLLKLPRCSKTVVIVSPRYGEAHYTCEIVVRATDLLPWAEHHADAVWSSKKEEQAARKALPIWLRGADDTADSTSYVPTFMYQVLRPYALNFINEGTAKIFCTDCQSFVTHVQMKKLNEKRDADWLWWTDVWKCPNGHQLYCEDHELHFHRRL